MSFTVSSKGLVGGESISESLISDTDSVLENSGLTISAVILSPGSSGGGLGVKGGLSPKVAD